MHGSTVVVASTVDPRPWRNGAGQTRELLVWPEDVTSWQMRISLASITRSGPFSPYPGVQRWLAVIEGNGVVLRMAGKEYRLDAASAPLHFGGDVPADCELLDGPTSDLNLMITDGHGQMLPAVAGHTWECALQQCGLFTRTHGTLTGPNRAVWELPPHTLFWMRGGAGASLRFDPTSVGPGPGGIWLAFDRGRR
jgi:hypothetical protein